MEFRHPSWRRAEVETLLRSRNVAWVLAETDEEEAERRDTADFRYLRLRKSDYPDRALAGWAEWIRREAAGGRACYVYFKHEDEGSPWLWADRLRELAGVSSR